MLNKIKKASCLINDSESLLNKINHDRINIDFYSNEARNDYLNKLRNLRKDKIKEALALLQELQQK